MRKFALVGQPEFSTGKCGGVGGFGGKLWAVCLFLPRMRNVCKCDSHSL